MDYFKRKYGKFAKYIPIEQKSVWMCTCGTINHEGEQECCLCRLDRDTILDIDFEEEKKETVYYVSISYLETSNIGLIKVAEENFKQLKKYKDSKKKCEECLQKIQTLQQENKRWKKLMIIFACIIIAICATAFVFDVVIPNKKYQDVQRLIYNEEYAKAIEKIEELPKGYKDTSELLEKCYMSYAEQLVEEKKFEEALELYEQMEKKFEELFDASQQQKDIEIKNAIKKTKYQYANYLLENEKYEEAYNIYSELDGYLDSIYDKKKECASKLGDIALENKEYDKAVNWYELAKNTELGNEAKYEYVKEHNNSTDTKTYEYLVMLSKAGYKDSLSIYNQLYDVSCKVIINSKENDTSSSPLKFKQYDATYIHYQITGNVPAGAGNIRLEYERADTKNAKDDVYTHSSKDAVPIGEWQLEEVTFYPSGYYYKISIYNSDTDEKICSSKKVYVSDD